MLDLSFENPAWQRPASVCTIRRLKDSRADRRQGGRNDCTRAGRCPGTRLLPVSHPGIRPGTRGFGLVAPDREPSTEFHFSPPAIPPCGTIRYCHLAT